MTLGEPGEKTLLGEVPDWMTGRWECLISPVLFLLFSLLSSLITLLCLFSSFRVLALGLAWWREGVTGRERAKMGEGGGGAGEGRGKGGNSDPLQVE